MSAQTESIAVAKPSSWYRQAHGGLYVLIVVAGLLAAFAYKLRSDGILACPAGGYGADSYLSDCQANAYGDYDHGAFWFGLEPGAQRAASDAQVLFLGSSRLQFALSDETTANWFKAHAIRFYLLGFSHSETVEFFGPLLERLRPRARVYVVNVDRVFDDRVSPPVSVLRQERDALGRYREKRWWQSVHRSLCGALPFACGNSLAVYRERETGIWRMAGKASFAARDTSDGAPSNTDRWDEYAKIGKAFVATLPVERSCVILTLVPTVDTKRQEAQAIAQRLGLELLTPAVDGLRTFDGSHLDAASARKWSQAFLEQAGPIIRKCVGGNAAPRQQAAAR